MTSPADSQLEAACPYCRATITLSSEPGAKEVRCGKCAEMVPLVLLNVRTGSARQIVSQTDTTQVEASGPNASAPPTPSPPEEVRVICRLCRTIVYAPIADVGKEIKCPDCYSMNVILPPPKPQKKVEVQLEEEDAFHLQESLDQPTPESASRQQKWYMPRCPSCFTDIRLTVEHAGTQVKCPDCHTEFTAAEPPAEPEQRPTVVVDDTYELTLSEPVERPPVDVDDLIGSKQVPMGSELKAAATKGDLNTRDKLRSLHKLVKGEHDAEEEEQPEPDLPLPDIRGARPNKPQQDDEVVTTDSTATAPAESQPEVTSPPDTKPKSEASADSDSNTSESTEDTAKKTKRRFAFSAQDMFLKKLLTSGLGTVLKDQTVLAMALAIALSVAVTLWIGALTIDQFQIESLSPGEKFFLLAQSAFFALLILLSVVLIANTMLPIVISTSLDQDQVENWPPFSLGDWIVQGFYIINSLAIGALPTVILVPFLNTYVLSAIQLITIVPVFPIAILSMLDEGSPFGPYSPGLWRTIGSFKGLWLRFTIVGYLVGSAGALLAGLVIYTGSFLLSLIAGTVIAASIVIYARFLGRMAMFMSDQSIIEDESLAEYD